MDAPWQRAERMKNEPSSAAHLVPANEAEIHVWIVEDHAEFRNTVMRVLGLQHDFKTQAFTRCEEALTRFKQGDRPHVLLLDIGLPGMSGLEAIKHFRSLSPATQVIMLTAFDDPPRVRKALQSGASGYLLKTTDAREISARIREVLQGGAPLDARIARHVLEMIAARPGENRYALAPREREVLEGLVKGKTVKEIAADLHLSYYTVDTYLRRLYDKLDVQSRSLAVSKALQEHLL